MLGKYQSKTLLVHRIRNQSLSYSSGWPRTLPSMTLQWQHSLTYFAYTSTTEFQASCCKGGKKLHGSREGKSLPQSTNNSTTLHSPINKISKAVCRAHSYAPCCPSYHNTSFSPPTFPVCEVVILPCCYLLHLLPISKLSVFEFTCFLSLPIQSLILSSSSLLFLSLFWDLNPRLSLQIGANS